MKFPLGTPRNAWKKGKFWRAIVPTWEGNKVQNYMWLSQHHGGWQTRTESHWEFHSHVWSQIVCKPWLYEWHTLHLIKDWKGGL